MNKLSFLVKPNFVYPRIKGDLTPISKEITLEFWSADGYYADSKKLGEFTFPINVPSSLFEGGYSRHRRMNDIKSYVLRELKRTQEYKDADIGYIMFSVCYENDVDSNYFTITSLKEDSKDFDELTSKATIEAIEHYLQIKNTDKCDCSIDFGVLPTGEHGILVSRKYWGYNFHTGLFANKKQWVLLCDKTHKYWSAANICTKNIST